MLYLALEHGLPHGGILRDGVADDHQSQVAINRVRRQLLAQHGEGFHQPRDVLVVADGARVEQKRAVDLITLHDPAALFLADGRVAPEKTRIGRVVDARDAVGRDVQQVLDIALGGLGNRDHPAGARQAAAETEAPQMHVQGG